ncbi:hypothetical protein B9Z55_022536 [Caenorhabditis nigoni]|nr:hypothetical protein B9Z55_022536 [Caenorhabditis nigoni]
MSLLFITTFLIHCTDSALSFYYDPQLYVPKYRDYLEAQGNLTKDLFRNYEKDVSPVYAWCKLCVFEQRGFDSTSILDDTSKPLGYDKEAPQRWNYTLFLYSLKLVEVNEPEEQVSVVLELMENDNNIYQPRLSPKTKLTDENRFFKKIRIYRNDIIDFRDQDFRLVCLDNLGMIYDYLSARVSANCRMNVARFPFDTQICQIRFSLPIFSYKEVQIFSEVYEGIQNPSAFHNMGNSEWRLVNLTNRVDFLSFQDRFDLELAVFEIKITRNPLYYFYMIVFPSFVINSVSIMGIFLKGADKMSKLNVGLTNIMTMTFILGVMSDKIPRTGSIPLLGVYIIINLLIMLAAIFVVMMITKLRRWALPILKKKKTPMSRKLETFIGSPLEYTCAVILELITCANFFVMIGFWIDDQETVSAEAST